jgi:hypothetical protein
MGERGTKVPVQIKDKEKESKLVLALFCES